MVSPYAFNIKRHFLLSALLKLGFLILVIGYLFVHYHELQLANTHADEMGRAYRFAIETRRQILLNHQYLLDAVVTRQELSFQEAREHLLAAQKALTSLSVDYPAYRARALSIQRELASVASLDVKVMHVYLNNGMEVGNQLMETPGGLDTKLDTLLDHCEQLLAEVSADARHGDERVDELLTKGMQTGIIAALLLLLANITFFIWTYRRLYQVMGAEPAQIRQLLENLVRRGISSPAMQEAKGDVVTLSRMVEHLLIEHERVNKALEASELGWRNLMRNMPGGILRLAAEAPYPFEYLSEGMAQLTGRPSDGFIGETGVEADYPSADFAPLRVTAISDAIAARKPYELDYHLHQADGVQRWVREIGQGRFDADGRLLGIDGIILDNTAVKAANRHVEKLRSQMTNAIESIDVGFLMYDEAGYLVVCNEAFQRLYPGMRPWLIPGQPMVEILKNYYRHADAACRASHPHEFGVKDEAEFIERWILGWEGNDRLKPIRVLDRWVTQERATSSDGTQVLLRADVTELVELSKAHEEAKEAAEQSNLAKSVFLANMSHEIRTPMNGVLGMTELTLQTALNTEQRENLDMVKASADALMVVINDILDFSKIEAGKLDFEQIPFSLRTMLNETLHPLRLRAADKGVTLDCAIAPGIPDYLLGDPSRLRQILTNLAGNALKFTKEGEIGVDVELLSQEASSVMLRMTVRDTGIGIPADKLASIFEPFSQADNSITRRFGGTGLGLAISRRLVNLMGGDITASSEPGRGSHFYFDIALPVSELAASALLPAASLADQRALALDDNLVNCAWLVATLRRWNIKTTVVETCAQASQKLASEHFDIVLLDDHLPDGSGIDLLPSARETQPAARVLVLSSAASKGDSHLSRERGADAYLKKPLLAQDLLDALCQAPPAPMPARAIQTLEAAPPLPAQNVLLAEDNEVNQKLVVRLLEKHGHSVVVVGDGQSAVDAVLRERFDIVLMDLHMPGMGGIEATKAIRLSEAGGTRHLPIIALTANAMTGVREECLAAGMDGYVSKPVRQDALEAEWRRVRSITALPPQPVVPEPTASVQSAAYDPQTALALFDDDKAFFQTLVGAFEACADKHLSNLHGATSADEFKTACFSAHAFKGAAGGINAMALFELSQRAESAARVQDGEELEKLYGQLLTETSQTLRLLKDFFVK